jgi:hypothetical protein
VRSVVQNDGIFTSPGLWITSLPGEVTEDFSF